jgi:hypothetical protein
LESSREVRCLADDGLLLCCSCSDQIADHNEAGRYPDAHLEWRASGSRELRNRLDKGERGANRTLGIILVRFWDAEIGENAVTHVLGDETAVVCSMIPVQQR